MKKSTTLLCNGMLSEKSQSKMSHAGKSRHQQARLHMEKQSYLTYKEGGLFSIQLAQPAYLGFHPTCFSGSHWGGYTLKSEQNISWISTMVRSYRARACKLITSLKNLQWGRKAGKKWVRIWDISLPCPATCFLEAVSSVSQLLSCDWQLLLWDIWTGTKRQWGLESAWDTGPQNLQVTILEMRNRGQICNS